MRPPKKKKVWKRKQDAGGYAQPKDDLNAPDLYIPTMAFVTYVLLIGFVMGASAEYASLEKKKKEEKNLASFN
jgi:hypothetical protein